MSTTWKTLTQRHRKLPALVCLGAILALTLSSAGAGLRQGDAGGNAAQNVLRVEMDFRLNLNEPGDNLDAPQFHTVMSPFGNLDSHYIQVTWNYREKPDFLPGGVQVQSWNGDQFVAKKDISDEKLSFTAESISWTQVMETNGTNLTFYIKDGKSATWGRFGGLETSVSEQAPVADLNKFDHEVTIKNTVFTYGANRVDRLTIKEIRRYGAEGLISVDKSPKPVFVTSDVLEPTQ